MRALFLVLAAITAVLCAAPPAAAHGMRTAYLEVIESAPGAAVATLKVTAADPLVTPRFPEGCEATSAGAPAANAQAFVIRCDGPLAGREIGVDGLGPILSEAVVRVALHDGGAASAVLTADHARLQIPRRTSAIAVARAYVGRGVVHILTGADHLLFLLALALHLRRVRAVLLAETAFTISHSLSFSATALGLVRASSAAAEAAIALSLVLLAGEAVRSRDRDPSLLGGAASALVFGLVHGLGFAGGLAEIGVPDGAAAVALVGFGAGVEIGQVAFLAVVLALGALLSRRVPLPRLALAGGYGVGVAGAFWLFQRLWILFVA